MTLDKTMQYGLEDAREKKASTAHCALQMATQELERLRAEIRRLRVRLGDAEIIGAAVRIKPSSGGAVQAAGDFAGWNSGADGEPQP